jgi:hypothetical protein
MRFNFHISENARSSPAITLESNMSPKLVRTRACPKSAHFDAGWGRPRGLTEARWVFGRGYVGRVR